MSNRSTFSWISAISTDFTESGKAPVLRESSIHLHSTCGNIVSWIGVISANFKGSGKAPVLRESFIHLHSTCGNIVSF